MGETVAGINQNRERRGPAAVGTAGFGLAGAPHLPLRRCGGGNRILRPCMSRKGRPALSRCWFWQGHAHQITGTGKHLAREEFERPARGNPVKGRPKRGLGARPGDGGGAFDQEHGRSQG